MPAPSFLTVGRTPRGYVVRVVGRGTMRESPAFHAFAVRVLDEPGGAALDLDLAGCEYLDSTFLGDILVLYRRFERAGVPERFAVVGPGEHLRRLFGFTRIDTVVPLRDEGPESQGEEVLPAPQATDPEAFVRHVLECHRRLAEQGGTSAAVFGPIADQMARELDRDAGARPA